MGKSFQNDIKISDDDVTTSKKIMQCITDRSRARKDDPGHPDECEVIFDYYKEALEHIYNINLGNEVLDSDTPILFACDWNMVM